MTSKFSNHKFVLQSGNHERQWKKTFQMIKIIFNRKVDEF